MADNVPITAGSGTIIGTDEVSIGGVAQHVQRVKLVDGADGGTGLIGGDAANGLDVDVTRVPFATKDHDDANAAGNKLLMAGLEAIAHGTNPTAVAAADVTKWYANRAGVPFVMGGHPNIITTEYLWTTAQTDDAIATVGAGAKIVVTRIAVTFDEAMTVGAGFRIGFGATTLPTAPTDGNAAAGYLLGHAGVIPGGGIISGDGSGILGVGADGEDLRITTEATTSGTGRAYISYYTIES